MSYRLSHHLAHPHHLVPISLAITASPSKLCCHLSSGTGRCHSKEASAVRGGLMIVLPADVLATEEVRDVVDIVPGKVMALDVVTAAGTLTVINVYGPGSGGNSWAPKSSF